MNDLNLTDNKEDDFGMEQKTISMQEYKTLMSLIPKETQLENEIKKLKSMIQSRDLQLEELSKKLEQAKLIDVSNLTNVSISWEIFLTQYVIYIDI